MSGFSLSRRQAVAAALVGGIGASAGCMSFGDETDLTGNRSERQLKLTLAEHGPLRERFVVSLSETDLDWDEEAFNTTLDGDQYTTQYRTPFGSTADEPVYTRHEGTYYQLGSVVIDESTVSRPVLRLYEVENQSAASADAVAAAGLPMSDQRAVKIAFMAARARGNDGGIPSGLVQRGGYVYRHQQAVDSSDLLGEDGPSHVQYQVKPYKTEVTRETFHEPVHRATVVPVAETPEQMEAILRAQHVETRITSDELSADERTILRVARGDGYSEPHPYSERYQELLKKLHRRAYIDGRIDKDAEIHTERKQLLLYDTTYYDYHLRFATE